MTKLQVFFHPRHGEQKSERQKKNRVYILQAGSHSRKAHEKATCVKTPDAKLKGLTSPQAEKRQPAVECKLMMDRKGLEETFKSFFVGFFGVRKGKLYETTGRKTTGPDPY